MRFASPIPAEAPVTTATIFIRSPLSSSRYTRYSHMVYLVSLDVSDMKRVQKRDARTKEGTSAKPKAIVLAALELFTRYGYRRTSIDDIARAAQVAKRTVYLHFENKAALFLAILNISAIRCASSALPPSVRVARGWIN